MAHAHACSATTAGRQLPVAIAAAALPYLCKRACVRAGRPPAHRRNAHVHACPHSQHTGRWVPSSVKQCAHASVSRVPLPPWRTHASWTSLSDPTQPEVLPQVCVRPPSIEQHRRAAPAPAWRQAQGSQRTPQTGRSTGCCTVQTWSHLDWSHLDWSHLDWRTLMGGGCALGDSGASSLWQLCMITCAACGLPPTLSLDASASVAC